MKKASLIIALFSLLVLEGVAFELLPANLQSISIIIIPHWILVFLIIVSFSYETKQPYILMIYAIIFGLLVDIVYTDTLGIYMFAYGFALYTATLLKRILQANFVMTIFTTIIAVIITEAIVSSIYTVLGITSFYWMDNLTLRLIPTIIANIVFLLIFYPFVKKIISKLNNQTYN